MKNDKFAVDIPPRQFILCYLINMGGIRFTSRIIDYMPWALNIYSSNVLIRSFSFCFFQTSIYWLGAVFMFDLFLVDTLFIKMPLSLDFLFWS